MGRIPFIILFLPPKNDRVFRMDTLSTVYTPSHWFSSSASQAVAKLELAVCADSYLPYMLAIVVFHKLESHMLY